MLFKELDFLSPKISLYYKGSLSHSSLFSIILSIISFIIITTFSIYFSLDLIQRKNPDFYYLNRYVKDAGGFPLNSSSLFILFPWEILHITLLDLILEVLE